MRRYFFYLSERGHLYHVYNLEDFMRGARPSGPCYQRDGPMTDFFFKHLRRADSQDFQSDGELTKLFMTFPYCSPCGKKELNHVCAQDAPVVFHSLDGSTLKYAGTLTTEFDPLRLYVKRCNGRLYHSVNRRDSSRPLEGVLSSLVAVELGLGYIEEIAASATIEESEGGDPCDDTRWRDHVLKWKGEDYPLRVV